MQGAATVIWCATTATMLALLSSSSLGAQSAEKRAENVTTCLSGQYRALCQYDWLTPEQKERARRAELRENEKTCVSGQYRALCRHDELSDDARRRTAAAERRENLSTCLAGTYKALCHYDELTPTEVAQVKATERRENLRTCLSGSYPVLCDRSLLTDAERTQADAAEARAGKTAPRAQVTSPRVAAPTPRAAQRPSTSGCASGVVQFPSPFMGNHGEVFRLDDGTYWQVQVEYEYLYEYSPSVVVCGNEGFMVINKKELQVRAIEGAIESRIDGEFEGWDGETVFRLQNGQIWKQVGAGYKYKYKYNPKVLLYKDGSRFKLRVEDVDGEVAVERLR